MELGPTIWDWAVLPGTGWPAADHHQLLAREVHRHVKRSLLVAAHRQACRLRTGKPAAQPSPHTV